MWRFGGWPNPSKLELSVLVVERLQEFSRKVVHKFKHHLRLIALPIQWSPKSDAVNRRFFQRTFPGSTAIPTVPLKGGLGLFELSRGGGLEHIGTFLRGKKCSAFILKDPLLMAAVFFLLSSKATKKMQLRQVIRWQH